MMKCSLRLHVTTTVPGDARVDSCKGKGSKRWLRAEAAVSCVGLLTPPCSTNWSTADAAAKARYASLGFGASLEPRRAHCATRSAPTMSSEGEEEEEEGGGQAGENTAVLGAPRTELLARELYERAVVRAREPREGVSERATPVPRERQDHPWPRALQLAERRGVALAHLHVLLEVETRAAALVEERHSNLPRAILEHRRDDGARGRRRRMWLVRRRGIAVHRGSRGCGWVTVSSGGKKRATTFFVAVLN